MDLSANPNTYWSAIFVDELAHAGLESVCIAPGSRSTPLTLAFAAHPAIRVYRHLDERSAAFFALGLAMASGRPVALVCTSGTAAANFHPAVIEAYYARVPLLVLTADRPPELRGSGANQTIDQIKMFGDHVRWAVEVPTPQAEAPDVVLRHMRTLAARAYAAAGGLVKGPIHLNFPFRKPLEPTEMGGDLPNRSTAPFTRFSHGRLAPEVEQVAAVADLISRHPRGLILCGPNCPGGSFPTQVVALARQSGYPILADPLSGLRHGPHVAGKLVLGGYHLWLSALGAAARLPNAILRFGDVPTSSALAAYLGSCAPATHLHVRSDGEWADDQHLTHAYLQVDPELLCEEVAAQLAMSESQPECDWTEAFTAAEAQTWKQLDDILTQSPFFDGVAVSRLLTALPEDTVLFAGNSLPIRHVDTFDRPSERLLTVYGNRGASGIDGNVSTALGLAAASGKRVVALLGDITFYHDMNGLLAVRQHGLDNITFVVINNDGGGIFRGLPIARHDPPFTDLFLTPHGLTFEHAAAMYGLQYSSVIDETGLDKALKEAFNGPTGARLIEIKTDGAADFARQRAVAATIVENILQEATSAT